MPNQSLINPPPFSNLPTNQKPMQKELKAKTKVKTRLIIGIFVAVVIAIGIGAVIAFIGIKQVLPLKSFDYAAVMTERDPWVSFEGSMMENDSLAWANFYKENTAWNFKSGFPSFVSINSLETCNKIKEVKVFAGDKKVTSLNLNFADYNPALAGDGQFRFEDLEKIKNATVTAKALDNEGKTIDNVHFRWYAANASVAVPYFDSSNVLGGSTMTAYLFPFSPGKTTIKADTGCPKQGIITSDDAFLVEVKPDGFEDYNPQGDLDTRFHESWAKSVVPNLGNIEEDKFIKELSLRTSVLGLDQGRVMFYASNDEGKTWVAPSSSSTEGSKQVYKFTFDTYRRSLKLAVRMTSDFNQEGAYGDDFPYKKSSYSIITSKKTVIGGDEPVFTTYTWDEMLKIYNYPSPQYHLGRTDYDDYPHTTFLGLGNENDYINKKVENEGVEEKVKKAMDKFWEKETNAWFLPLSPELPDYEISFVSYVQDNTGDHVDDSLHRKRKFFQAYQRNDLNNYLPSDLTGNSPATKVVSPGGWLIKADNNLFVSKPVEAPKLAVDVAEDKIKMSRVGYNQILYKNERFIGAEPQNLRFVFAPFLSDGSEVLTEGKNAQIPTGGQKRVAKLQALVNLPSPNPRLDKLELQATIANIPEGVAPPTAENVVTNEITPGPPAVNLPTIPIIAKTPVESPPQAEEPAGIKMDGVIWHRGHSRVVLKWKFTEIQGKDPGTINKIDPKEIKFTYGEGEALNLGARVLRDPNDPEFPYVAVLTGLKGGEFSDKNEDGFENGRVKYSYQITIEDKNSGTITFKTMNRLQTIGYFYDLLLNRDYVSGETGNLTAWENLENEVEVAGKKIKIKDLENGGPNFWYKPEGGKTPLTLLGIKFAMLNDPAFKEFDEILLVEAQEPGSMTSAVQLLYRVIFDRIYIPVEPEVNIDLGKFFDDAGVEFWKSMTDPDLIKNYYPEKGKEDIIDVFGVKFALSVSKEYQDELLAQVPHAKPEFAYNVVLQRGADAPGLAYLEANFTLSKDMRAHLAKSKEYQDKIAALDRKAAIEYLYKTLYARPPDAGGVKFWDETGKTINGIVEEFLKSEEFLSL